MSFGHLHEVICRPASMHEWSGPSKLWRLQAHLLGYIPQCFAWALVIYQFILGASNTTYDSYGQKRQMCVRNHILTQTRSRTRDRGALERGV